MYGRLQPMRKKRFKTSKVLLPFSRMLPSGGSVSTVPACIRLPSVRLKENRLSWPVFPLCLSAWNDGTKNLIRLKQIPENRRPGFSFLICFPCRKTCVASGRGSILKKLYYYNEKTCYFSIMYGFIRYTWRSNCLLCITGW